jgi:hypothetical protein
MEMLQVNKNQIINSIGEAIQLRGTCIGEFGSVYNGPAEELS